MIKQDNGNINEKINKRRQTSKSTHLSYELRKIVVNVNFTLMLYIKQDKLIGLRN